MMRPPWWRPATSCSVSMRRSRISRTSGKSYCETVSFESTIETSSSQKQLASSTGEAAARRDAVDESRAFSLAHCRVFQLQFVIQLVAAIVAPLALLLLHALLELRRAEEQQRDAPHSSIRSPPLRRSHPPITRRYDTIRYDPQLLTPPPTSVQAQQIQRDGRTQWRSLLCPGQQPRLRAAAV